MNTTGGRKVSKADLLELARALGDEEVDEGESMLCIFQRALDRARELNAPAKLFDGGRTPHPKVREWCAQVMDYAAERAQEMNEKRSEPEDEKWTWYSVFGVVRDSTGRPCVHSFAPGAHTCMRGHCHVHIDAIEVDATCSHKFVDSKACLHCGVSANVLKAKHRRELEHLEATGPRPLHRAIVERAHAAELAPPTLPPLALIEDRSVEQLKADGDFVEPCEHAGELAIDRATGEESCTACDPAPAIEDLSHLRPSAHVERVRALLEEEPTTVGHLRLESGELVRVSDRRQNAEQWAKTRGSKGGATHA